MDKPGAIATLEEDIIVFKYIPEKYRAIEANLYTSKWFDYRFLSPVACTRLYAKAYVEAFRRAYRQNFDARSAPYIRPLKHDDIFDYGRRVDGYNATLTGLWRGRQFADALGMPYETFLAMSFDITLRYWKQRYAPMPQHLYSSWVIEKIAAQWPEQQLTRLYVAEDSRYGNDWYAGTREQNAHHEWLFNQAMIRGRDELLWSFIEQKLIPIGKVEARLDPDQLKRFHEYSTQDRA